MTAPAKPVVYAFENYRAYLRAYYEFRKAGGGDFSYRKFSEAAGFKSPNFLKLVIDGQRNLTKDSLRRLAFAMKLDNDENFFFRNLVLLNQASHSTDKLHFAQQLNRSAVFRNLYPLRPAQFDYYSNWFYIPIREMVANVHFKEDGVWIAKKLGGNITADQARQAMHAMIQLGLLERGPEGRLKQATPNVTTGHEVMSPAVAEFHRQMSARAAASIDDVPRFQRELSSSTLLLTDDEFSRLKTMVQEFRRSLLGETAKGEKENARVYQINFQIFPLSEKLEDDEEKPCKKAS